MANIQGLYVRNPSIKRYMVKSRIPLPFKTIEESTSYLLKKIMVKPKDFVEVLDVE